MLGQPNQPTPYDLRFAVFGVPVRVHPVFWLTAAFLSWSDSRLDLTLLGVLVVFVSVLIHELGHALVTRRLGWYPEIVLEFLGGYATTKSHSRWGNIAVAAAGPGAGFLLYAAVRLFLKTPAAKSVGESEYLQEVISQLLVLNWGWSLMNLIPVWPLDGSKIAQELIGLGRPYDAFQITLKLSIVVAVGLAGWAWLRP